MRKLAAALLLLALAAMPSRAGENLVSGISQDTVEINSSYTGTEILVYGAIENPDPGGIDDVVVIVRGPDADMTVRQKQWVGGIWINRDQAKIQGMPSYYYLASTRPLNKIAASFTLERYEIGLNSIVPEEIHSHHYAEPFRQALIRHKKDEKLYGEDPEGVVFQYPTLFRARVPVPAEVPRGQYNVVVYLFRDGNVVSAQSTPFFVDQTGIERRLYRFAHSSPLSYGISTVFMALLLGWISSMVFRRND